MCTRCFPLITISQQDLILREIARQFPRESPLFGLLDEFGLRLSEVLAVTAVDISKKAITIHQIWTGSALAPIERPRTISLSDPLGNRLFADAQALLNNPRPPAHPLFMFTNIHTGKPYSRLYLYNHVWLQVLHTLKLQPTHMSVLRQNAARRFIRNMRNVSPQQVAYELGIRHRFLKPFDEN